MNPGAGDHFYPHGEFAQYPSGWIYPYKLNDRGNVNHNPSASVKNAESLPESSPGNHQTVEVCGGGSGILQVNILYSLGNSGLARSNFETTCLAIYLAFDSIYFS